MVLEANAAGLPIIATDVGACRELVEGRTPEDRALGISGMITPVATPNATAAALEELAKDPALCVEMGAAGRERVKRFYDLRDVMHRYQELYESFIRTGIEEQPVEEVYEEVYEEDGSTADGSGSAKG